MNFETLTQKEIASVLSGVPDPVQAHWEPTIKAERVKRSFRPAYGRI